MTKRIRTDYNKNYYQKHKDQIKECQRKYRENHKDQRDYYQRNYRKTDSGRASKLLYAAKQRAKRKGMLFDLDKKWILKKLKKRVCEYSGLKLELEKNKNGYHHSLNAPSLDRKDSRKGYTRRNTFLVAWCINSAKGAWNKKDWKKVREAIRRIK